MFFKLNNLKATAITEIDKPWELPPVQYPASVVDKETYSAWGSKLTSTGCFISMSKGVEPGLRISNENRPRCIYGIIVDYDAPINDDIAARYMANPPNEHFPAWRVVTFSGHARLVWVFEEPVWISCKEQLQSFYMYINKELNLDMWLPGMDDGAYKNQFQYYELGRKWIPWAPDNRIPKTFTRGWLYESSKRITMVPEYQDLVIPLDAVAEEVEKQFPGKWKGPFELGARGVRFWDDKADNDTGAYIMAHGVMAFSGEQSFRSWGSILGKGFTERFKMDKLAAIEGRTASDGEDFWMLYDDGGWKSLPERTLIRHLKLAGFNHKPPKGSITSEIDSAIAHIDKNCRVEAAIPFVHMPTGIIYREKKRYLNTTTAQCIPSMDLPEFRTFADVLPYCPYIWKLVKSLFVDRKLPDRNVQVHVFLAYIKRFYENGKAHKPNQGQLLVLAGPSGIGKSLLIDKVVGPLVGGTFDASQYFLEKNRFTSSMLHSPVLKLDDPEPVQTYSSSVAFAARLKRVVACPRMLYEAKYHHAGEVEYYGRIILIANMDGNSRQAIPEIDTSMQDKVMLLNCSHGDITFGENSTVEATIAQELPYFARFLELWTPPLEVMSKRARFGVISYKHPDLYKEVVATSANSFIQEVLQDFLNAYAEANPDKTYWEGKSTTLYEEVAAFKPAAMRDLRPNQFSTNLSRLTKQPFLNISYISDRHKHTRLYRLDFNLVSESDNMEYDEELERNSNYKKIDLVGTTPEPGEEEGVDNNAGNRSEELASVRETEGEGVQQGKRCENHERELGEASQEEEEETPDSEGEEETLE